MTKEEFDAMGKEELVRRARNLNQQALGYKLSGSAQQADKFRKRRDEFILRARQI